MLIKSEFDIQFQLPQPTAMVAMLHLHPSLERYVRTGNVLVIEHLAPGVGPGYGELIGTLEYSDSFGNRCSRFVAPTGHRRLGNLPTSRSGLCTKRIAKCKVQSAKLGIPGGWL